jgi:hypothetical protein
LHEGLGYARSNGTLSLSRIFLGTPRFLQRSTVGIESFAALSISPPRSHLPSIQPRNMIAYFCKTDEIAFAEIDLKLSFVGPIHPARTVLLSGSR